MTEEIFIHDPLPPAGPRLLAFGGGGATHGTDPALETALLRLLPGPRPRIGYIGAANGDAPDRAARFRARLAGLARVDALPAAAGAAEAAAWAAVCDAVYVAGGDTGRLRDLWRASGVGAALAEAARRGVLLAGVSAGAVVWFEQALSEAGGQGLRPLAGLGLFAGSVCPHHSAEPARAPAFRAAIAAGALPAGLALDDGAGVLIDDRGARVAVSARPGAWGWRVRRGAAGAVTERLPAASGA